MIDHAKFSTISDELQNLFLLFFLFEFFLVFSFENLNLTIYCETSHWSAYNLNQNLQLDIASNGVRYFNTGYLVEVSWENKVMPLINVLSIFLEVNLIPLV